MVDAAATDPRALERENEALRRAIGLLHRIANLVRAADQSLLRAKAEGKNRLRFA